MVFLYSTVHTRISTEDSATLVLLLTFRGETLNSGGHVMAPHVQPHYQRPLETTSNTVVGMQPRSWLLYSSVSSKASYAKSLSDSYWKRSIPTVQVEEYIWKSGQTEWEASNQKRDTLFSLPWFPLLDSPHDTTVSTVLFFPAVEINVHV